jgi:hypothetical protein
MPPARVGLQDTSTIHARYNFCVAISLGPFGKEKPPRFLWELNLCSKQGSNPVWEFFCAYSSLVFLIYNLFIKFFPSLLNQSNCVAKIISVRNEKKVLPFAIFFFKKLYLCFIRKIKIPCTSSKIKRATY